MHPLTLVLAECGLELVPPELWEDPAVRAVARKRSKRPGETLLDISLHYKAMRRLRDWFKRGRPDIVHVVLLIALSSLLNRMGLLRVYVHTIDGKVIEIDPRTRVPRNYNRFVGLMEQLLMKGAVPPGSEKPLMTITGLSLRELVSRACDLTIIMHERATVIRPRDLGATLSRYMTQGRVCVVIGGFQRGDFSEETLSLSNVRFSLYPQPLDTWTVVAKVISVVEEEVGALGIEAMRRDPE